MTEALDFLKKGKVYIKYETILPLNDMTKIPLMEITQHTDSKTEVNYSLKVNSLDKHYRPSMFGRNKTFTVEQYKEGYIILHRQYESVSLKEKNKATLIPSLFFFNIASQPLRESSRTFKILDPSSIKETYLYKTRKVKVEKEKKLVYYPLEDYIEIISSPKIIIKIDERENFYLFSCFICVDIKIDQFFQPVRIVDCFLVCADNCRSLFFN